MALYIAHHFGLGDHFVCSGLVRYFAKAYTKVFVFTLNTYAETVQALYSDTAGRIEPFVLDNSWKLETYRSRLSSLKDIALSAHGSYKQIGFKPIETHPGASFDDSFYIQSKVNFNVKWNNFKLPERYYLKDEQFEKNPSMQEYAFVHQDKLRGYIIDTSKICLPIVEPDFLLKRNALSWIETIQNASEIHCIDSSFINLIDLLDENIINMRHNGRLYYHYYSRNAAIGAQPHLRKKWIRLNNIPSAKLIKIEDKKFIDDIAAINIKKKLSLANPHISDSNLGDIVSTPLLYFDFPNHEPFQLDLRRVCTNTKEKEKGGKFVLDEQPLIIGGGGLIWQCHSQMDWIGNEHKKFKCTWGVGHNSHFISKEENAWPKWILNYNVHGIRDYDNQYGYLPDASCMSKLFDGEYVIKYRYGIYYHAENVIETEGTIYDNYPKCSNFYPSFEKVIDLLKSCDTIITNTYHGTYWSLLLNKRVIVYKPFSTRFKNFKYVPPVITHLNQINDTILQQCPDTYGYLDECRNLNVEYHKKILTLI